MQRLPARLHDFVHQRKISPRLRMAARWWHGRLQTAEEKDLIALPDELSFADGAQVACGFGTVYEGLTKIGIDGNHAVLITGLGPVGLATGVLCRKLGANKIIGIDVVPERMKIAMDPEVCDIVLTAGPDNVAQVKDLTGGRGVERAIECSAIQPHAPRRFELRASGERLRWSAKVEPLSSIRPRTSFTIRRRFTARG